MQVGQYFIHPKKEDRPDHKTHCGRNPGASAYGFNDLYGRAGNVIVQGHHGLPVYFLQLNGGVFLGLVNGDHGHPFRL
jgi:hypothetical protein